VISVVWSIKVHADQPAGLGSRIKGKMALKLLASSPNGANLKGLGLHPSH
jgi:hypothetical protein